MRASNQVKLNKFITNRIKFLRPNSNSFLQFAFMFSYLIVKRSNKKEKKSVVINLQT